MLKFHRAPGPRSRPRGGGCGGASPSKCPRRCRQQYRGSAGQHVVLRAALDGEELRRTYSLVNAPGEWPLRIVPRVHASGACRVILPSSCEPGSQLEVLPPNGSFTPRAVAARAPDLRRLRRRLRHHPCRVGHARAAGRPGHGCCSSTATAARARAMCLEELLALLPTPFLSSTAARRQPLSILGIVRGF